MSHSDALEDLKSKENVKPDPSLKTSHECHLCVGENSKFSIDSDKADVSNEIGQNNTKSFSVFKAIRSGENFLRASILISERLLGRIPSITLYDIFTSEPDFVQERFKNRFDYDENLDIQIYVSSDQKTILEVVCSKSIIYTSELYNNQLLKVKKFDLDNFLFENMKKEFLNYFMNENLTQSKVDDYIFSFIYIYKLISKINSLKNQNQMKYKELTCSFLFRDLKHFVELFRETYGDKIIWPDEVMLTDQYEKTLDGKINHKQSGAHLFME